MSERCERAVVGVDAGRVHEHEADAELTREQDAPPFAGGCDFWGLHTGVLRRDGSPKPALDALREAVATLTSRR